MGFNVFHFALDTDNSQPFPVLDWSAFPELARPFGRTLDRPHTQIDPHENGHICDIKANKLR
jgi:hypothetical protein